MKVFSDCLSRLYLIFSILATHSVISTIRKCDPATSKAYSSKTAPGTCTTASVDLQVKSRDLRTQTWVYECELPMACIQATWQVKWAVNHVPMNATALYNSTDSSLPKFDKILLINATTKPPPKGFSVNSNDGYLYLITPRDDTISVHIRCEGFVCLPNKTVPLTTNPPSTVSQTRRDLTTFISPSSRSQSVTHQVADTTESNTDNDVIANAETQTSNAAVAITVPLTVIFIAILMVLSLLYHYGFLKRWALLDSYLERLRVNFSTSNPEDSTPESDPLNSSPARAS
ncbi:m10 protein [Murid betaherpesvirus 1]|nr:m10 protein [Murid betaherpesvirus 1]